MSQILKAKHNSDKLETESDIDHEESDLANATTSRARPTPKAKVIVTPHIKWKEVSSQNQGLTPVAKGMGDLASALKKMHKTFNFSRQEKREVFLRQHS